MRRSPASWLCMGNGCSCGAIAGGLIGWPLMNDWNAMWVAGICRDRDGVGASGGSHESAEAKGAGVGAGRDGVEVAR